MTEEAPAADSNALAQGPCALEEFLARLSPRLSAAIGAMFRTPVHVELTERSGQTRGAFLASVADGGCCIRLAAGGKGHRVAMHLDIPPATAFAVVDWLLGGRPATAGRPDGAFVPNRPLTAIEQQVLRRFAAAIAGALAEAWPAEVQVETPGGESPAAPDDREARATVATFSLLAGMWEGAIRLCIPWAIIPTATPSLEQSEEASPEAVEVSVDVEGPSVTPEELAGLAANDIVITDTPADGEVIVRVGGKARFAGRLGVAGGKRAITITRRLDPA